MQPPGITLLMTPAALLAQVTGTAWGMAAGRILTVAASSAGIVLVGLLVRHRGLLPVALSCGVLAIFPGSLVAAHTVLLEPWLTLFCLIGALVLLDRDQFAPQRQAAAVGRGGVRLRRRGRGVGHHPGLVVAVLLAREIRRAALFVAGVAIGFCVPVIPFAADRPAPVLQQLLRGPGVPRGAHPDPGGEAAAADERDRPGAAPGQHRDADRRRWHHRDLIVVARSSLAWLVTRRPLTDLDWFAVATCTLIVVAFLWYAQFFLHFPAFLAPFLGLSIGLAAAG